MRDLARKKAEQEKANSEAAQSPPEKPKMEEKKKAKSPAEEQKTPKDSSSFPDLIEVQSQKQKSKDGSSEKLEIGLQSVSVQSNPRSNKGQSAKQPSLHKPLDDVLSSDKETTHVTEIKKHISEVSIEKVSPLG